MRRIAQLAASILIVLAAGAAAGDEPAAAPLVAQQLEAARERYLRLIAEGRNAEAAGAGQEVLTLSQQIHGDGSQELASPLTNLATAQLRNGQLQEAEANYQAAIALLEKGNGFLSPRLVNPLLGLGEAGIRSGQYALATEAYARALRVNHVNEGFYNLEQIRIRDGLSEGYLGQQDLDKANFHQEAQIQIQQRKLGRDNPELVAPLTKLGRWYDRTRQAEAARFAYQSAARIVQKADGEASPDMVGPLLAIAATYRQQALLPPDPDSGDSPLTLMPLASMNLRRALEIVEAKEPPDVAQRARILVELGDLYLMWGKPDTAGERYKEAWAALSSQPGLEQRRDELFAAPALIMVSGAPLPTIFPVPARKEAQPAAKDLEPAYVVVRFDVDESGKVSSAQVVEADPAGLLEERVAETAKRALYRPRYVDGAAVPATGLILRHDFRYAPKKLEKSKDKPSGDDGDVPLAQPGASGPEAGR